MNRPPYPVLCCSIAGHPSKIGVQIHNAGYAYLGLDYTYVAFGIGPDEAAAAAQSLRTLGIRGCGVTMPFKETIIPYLDDVTPDAGAIGAVNAIVNENGSLLGCNTDWLGAVRAVEERTTIAGKQVVVVGAGGAARAIAYGMKHEGAARVSIFNRTPDRAEKLAADLGCDFGGDLDALGRIGSYDILIHTTSVGFQAPPTDCAVPRGALRPGTTVLDIVSEPVETLLIQWAKAAGCTAIPGFRMRLHQAHIQFELYTKREIPIAVLDAALRKAMGLAAE